ncbi:MAG: tyrosine-type recombinase/integrase [Campylobacteraceae bacterium]|jgi:integrase/recombinase XerD|nr:tyrosine-type recombinase/integrase [Campylobacteraceae bacterium]MBT3882058.1 tyrosine-type recombinase/integrase [Campylobacteraceae bacterium]MBT4030246.1 tyrosine-type recombinase/integrase [Campylobacteraceae bacterium]MBT4572451.1 tyrosine-type recombinase/integrase [Campylobacteraceae bacterium]MBT4707378.1 tyrosine-type recombinase/integrase [Campylobacteraceae bacterium]
MRYPLDIENTFSKTYLFWLTRFLRNKITSLSNRQVTDKNRLAQIIQELIKGFDNIHKLKLITKEVRNIGISSIHVYYLPLEKLYNYMIQFGAGSMKEIDEELLSDFLASETANLSDATKKNYRIALLGFFGYIDKQNEEENGNIYRYGIELKNWGGLAGKSGTKLPSYLNKEEVNKFITAIDKYEFKNSILAVRNRLVIKIILYTGIRVGEAININIKDFVKEDDAYIIQVRGKGNKPRVVMIKEKIIKSDLSTWLDTRCCDDNLFLCNQKGKKLTQAYISRIVEQILMSIGLRKEKNGAHMLRHTFATLLYQKSKDLILVQESLGHADINTSRIYTHFDISRLDKTTDIF